MPVVTIGGKKVFVVPSITPHKPIRINGDPNFTKENGVVSGSGTANDPYIIENWDIDTSENRGIYIEHTDAYFIIRNCAIHDNKSSGIELFRVSNCKIERVTLYNNNADGISLCLSSEKNIITKCDIYDNKHYGIWLHMSPNNQITKCDVYKNAQGIHVYDSLNIQIHYCNIHGNKELDIYSNNTPETKCDAKNNWWGTVSGPGPKAFGDVIFDPWLKDRYIK